MFLQQFGVPNNYGFKDILSFKKLKVSSMKFIQTLSSFLDWNNVKIIFEENVSKLSRNAIPHSFSQKKLVHFLFIP